MSNFSRFASMLLLCSSSILSGQNSETADIPGASTQPSTPKLPEKILLPWMTPGIDARMRAGASQVLETAFEALKSQWIGSGARNLAETNGNRHRTGNAMKYSGKIAVSAAESPDDSQFIQPIWCKIGDRHIIALQHGDSFTGLLVQSFHLSEQIDASIGLGEAARFDWIRSLASQNLAKIGNQSMRTTPNDRAVKLSLELLNTSTRLDRGSNDCLNAILAESLIAIHRVQFAMGLESLTHLRWQRGITQPLERANRTIAVAWYPEPAKPNTELKLPARFRANFEYTEAVFASPLSRESNIAYSIGVNQNRVVMQPHQGLSEFIRQQERALAVGDKPQIAHIYGAWVYLDKGRAYGLKINDRLITQVGNDSVKGHVVGFFGSGVGIKSPRGFKIDEGAIVFIRKGQNLVKLGLEFDFDQTAYPTEYPPKEASNANQVNKQ